MILVIIVIFILVWCVTPREFEDEEDGIELAGAQEQLHGSTPFKRGDPVGYLPRKVLPRLSRGWARLFHTS